MDLPYENGVNANFNIYIFFLFDVSDDSKSNLSKEKWDDTYNPTNKGSISGVK